MLKKMMLVASMALAAIAFAVPASASALEWTDNGEAFGGEIHQTISGFIAFGNPAAGQTKFGCEAHAGITFEGGTSTGTLTSFEPTTETCVGEGAFAGCVLESHETTIPTGTQVHIVNTENLTITSPAGNPIVIHNVYAAPCPIEKTTLTVEHLNASTSDSTLTDLTVSGLGLSHLWTRSPTVESTSTVGVFGTMGTATDTITIS